LSDLDVETKELGLFDPLNLPAMLKTKGELVPAPLMPHLNLNQRANEISTVNPAASFSSGLDHACGNALPLSRPCYFADAL